MAAEHTEPVEVVFAGDDLLSIAVGTASAAQALAAELRASGDWLAAVAGIDSVVVQFDPVAQAPESAAQRLQVQVEAFRMPEETETRLVTIPVVYDGEDLGSVCQQLGIDREEFIRLHTGNEHRVEMLGFMPGYAYIGGLDPKLNVPRLANPRQRVPQGSVGITGGHTGLYAIAAPGGWPLIGRTDARLYDWGADEPFLLAPGMRVRFESVPGNTPS